MANTYKSAPFIGLVLLCTACSSTQTSAPSTIDLNEKVQHKNSIKLTGEHRLEISNPLGDLQIRKGSVGVVEINLFVQRLKGSKADSSVGQTVLNGILNLEVLSNKQGKKNDLLRVDAVITVPESPELRLTTRDSTIDARKLNNPLIEAFSQSGEVKIIATSIVKATTSKGDIHVTIMQPGWNGESRLISTSGRIQASIPLGPNLILWTKAGKNIISEFKLDIQDQGHHQAARFSSGNGSDSMTIESLKGSVELYSTVFDPRVFGPASISAPQTAKPQP